MKTYYQRNKVRLDAWQKAWRARNPEKNKAACKRYQMRNRERIRAQRQTPEWREKERQWRNGSGWRSYRNSQLKHRYGITLEQYEWMLIEQEGLCAICRREPSKNFAVDHCATSGKVRGLLCHSCNAAIGLLDHKAATLLAAVRYLQERR